MLALAAYNAGEGNVDKWIDEGRDRGSRDIPFPETREYIKRVIDARGGLRPPVPATSSAL